MNHRMCAGIVLGLFACGTEPVEGAGLTSQDSTSEQGGATSSGVGESGGPAEASTSGAGTSGAPFDAPTSSEPVDASTSSEPIDASTTGAAETTGEGEGSSTGAASVCGDGIVQDGEECDDPGDIHCFKCYRDRRVFVTSKGFHGDWAASGVDYWCNQLAAQAGLITDYQPRFKPWASTSVNSAAERLFHSPGRYVMVNDLVFAESWDDIVAGNLLNLLDVDENGQTRDFPVWTGTAPDGSAVVDASHCDNWTDQSLEEYGHYGYSFKLDGAWTFLDAYVNPTLCGAEGALYCFESP